MTTRVLPDAEAIVVAYLVDHPDIVDLFADNPEPGESASGRVVARPYDRIVWPFLTCRRIGGSAKTHHWIDQAQLEIAGWSFDRSGTSGDIEAALICRTAVAALHDIPQVDPEGLGVVTGVRDLTSPRPIADPVTYRPRYIAEVLLTLHPSFDEAS